MAKRRNTMNSRDAAFDENLKEILQTTAAEADATFEYKADEDEEMEPAPATRKKRKRTEDEVYVFPYHCFIFTLTIIQTCQEEATIRICALGAARTFNACKERNTVAQRDEDPCPQRASISSGWKG